MDAPKARALERLEGLSARQLDLVGFWREASSVIATAVPHYLEPCWYSLDPASALMTSHFHEQMAEFPQEWLTAEYYEDDLHQIVDGVRSPAGISTLHELTDGDPSGTPRWQANMQMGGDQELLMRLRARTGDTWGAMGLYREPEQPLFSSEEKQFLAAASGPLAEGVRRSLLFGEAQDPEWPDGPPVVGAPPRGRGRGPPGGEPRLGQQLGVAHQVRMLGQELAQQLSTFGQSKPVECWGGEQSALHLSPHFQSSGRRAGNGLSACQWTSGGD